jgi:RND family efflux transporter MFP subunit
MGTENTSEETIIPTVEVVKLADFQEKNSNISSIGKVEALQEVTLSAQMSTEVRELNVRIGDKVEKNQILLKLDNTSLNSELRKANASIERLESGLIQQEAGATKEQIEQAKNAVEQTQAGLEQTQANNQALIKNAEIGVELAKASLKNNATSSQQSLENAYDTLKLTASNILSTIKTALTTAGDILGKSPGSERANDAYENYLGVKDISSISKANIDFDQTKIKYQKALDYKDNLDKTISLEEGEILEELVSSALLAMDESLSSMRELLDNSITGTSLPQSSATGNSLDGLKQKINAQVSYINQEQQSLQIQKQALLNIKIAVEGSSEQNSINYQKALQTLEDSKKQAEANLKTAQKGIETQQKALERALSAYNEVVAPPRDIDLSSTKASIREAEASRDLVLNRLEKSYIKAPFKGEVASVLIKENDFINTGDPAISLVNKDGLQIKSYINSKDVKLINEGSKAIIEENIEGMVSRISPKVDPETKKIEVITAIIGEDNPFVIGEFVEIKFKIQNNIENQNIFFLPFQAIKTKSDGSFVFTINSENKIEAHKVELGRVINNFTEVKNGLSPETEVITNVRGLNEGDEIKIKE